MGGVRKDDQKNDTEEEDVETLGDGMGIVETYAEYWPAKLKIGKKHPDPVVCTASLASVESADINYTLQIPEKVIEAGWLSALQLEAICYAAQAHERRLLDEDNSRAGFLIGDGAGVGKGRTIAGIIYENFLHKRNKAIWISFSNDLKYDAERDFHDIGAKIAVHSLSKVPYHKQVSSAAGGKINSGVLFCTYACLIAKSTRKGKLNTRMAQIADWCGPDFDGCIVFDECHKAKNLIPAKKSRFMTATQTGKAVTELQYLLPNARVVYSSATGASEPRNMAYMVRLGVWGVGTAFRTFLEFKQSVERRGVSAMELVAMDMKLRGMYVARQLSFQGVTFKVEKVPLTDEFIRTYDASVALWNSALKQFEQASYLMNVPPQTLKIISGQFWGAHQRFFKYLAIAAKVDHAVKITEEAVRSGKCVVIALQSTGEARTKEELDKGNGELDDYISTAKAVFLTLVEKQFPALNRSKTSFGESSEAAGISRKRKCVTNRRAARRTKRLRIGSSEEDDDDEYKYKPIKKVYSSDESDDCVKPKIKIKKEENTDESDFHPEEETDSSSSESEDEENSESSYFTVPTEDSDSDSGKKRKKTKKSNAQISKVQEQLTKLYQVSSKNIVKNLHLRRDIIEGVREMKDDLLKKIEELGDRLPKNTLDDLINKLGGSEKVAEMTGRKGRIAGLDNGTVQYESRSEEGVSLEMLNIKEKQRFMDGEKLIAIISEAASSGISLQSDRRVKNQRRRLHITLELPWAADTAIQQFGRTHRSNQVNAPEYMFLISDLAGEQRFVATVAKRLESLGALTHADRRATQTRDLSEFNIDNKYGRKALSSTIRAIRKLENPMLPPPHGYEGDFFADAHKALVDVDLDLHAVSDEGTKGDNIVRFLNRSLGVPVKLQNFLFKYFADTLSETIKEAKKKSTYEVGIMDIGRPERIQRISTKRYFHRHATGVAPVELHTVRVDRGIAWDEALEKSKTLTKEHEGFYIYRDSKPNKKRTILVTRLSDDNTLPPGLMMFALHRPNIGLLMRNESLAHLRTIYYPTTTEKAEEHWTYQYNVSIKQCSHIFYNDRCPISRFAQCDEGKRISTRVVLSGSVLGVWDRVERQLRGGEDGSGQFIRMQICRLRTNDGLGTTGILIPLDCFDQLSDELAADAECIEDVLVANGSEYQIYSEEIDRQIKKEEIDPEIVKEEVDREIVKEEVDPQILKEEFGPEIFKEEPRLQTMEEEFDPRIVVKEEFDEDNETKETDSHV